MRVPKSLRFVVALLALGVVIFLGICLLLGGKLAAPAPAAPHAIPADLPHEEVTFASASGSMIHGWFAPGRLGAGAVILLHGVRANRSELLPRAQLLWRAGYSVLLIDFQAHGASPGAHITFGYLESRDVRAAIGYVHKRLPGERLGGLGTSLGGAATLVGPQPAGFDAVVLESVYPTLSEATPARSAARRTSRRGNRPGNPENEESYT
jgi:alpha-beta hydrolase superfamily lysophospholipase